MPSERDRKKRIKYRARRKMRRKADCAGIGARAPGSGGGLCRLRRSRRVTRTVWRAAVESDDVALPVVEALAGPVYLPDYPRCPDCGGRIEWAEAGGVPGSRRCAGVTLPDLPAAGMAADPPGVTSDREAGCGSRFVDARFGLPPRRRYRRDCGAARTRGT